MKSNLIEDELFMGVYTLLVAGQFLDSAGYSHINICDDTVFIGLKGKYKQKASNINIDSKWRLGNPEFLVPLEQIEDTEHLSKIDKLSMRPESPESITNTRNYKNAMIDGYHQFLSNSIIPLVKKQRCVFDWTQLEDALEQKMNLDALLSLDFFISNPLTEVMKNLSDYRLKLNEEKERVFRY